MGEGNMFTKLIDDQFYKLSCIEEPALPRIRSREDPRPCSKPRMPWRMIHQAALTFRYPQFCSAASSGSLHCLLVSLL